MESIIEEVLCAYEENVDYGKDLADRARPIDRELAKKIETAVAADTAVVEHIQSRTEK